MARKADAGSCEWHYERRRPERTLLYQLVAEHYPRFIELLAAQDRTLPGYVQREFEDFLNNSPRASQRSAGVGRPIMPSTGALHSYGDARRCNSASH